MPKDTPPSTAGNRRNGRSPLPTPPLKKKDLLLIPVGVPCAQKVTRMANR